MSACCLQSPHQSQTKSASITYEVYINYIWSLHQLHMKSASITYEVCINHVWSLHQSHMKSASITYEVCINYIWSRSQIESHQRHQNRVLCIKQQTNWFYVLNKNKRFAGSKQPQIVCPESNDRICLPMERYRPIALSLLG